MLAFAVFSKMRFKAHEYPHNQAHNIRHCIEQERKKKQISSQRKLLLSLGLRHFLCFLIFEDFSANIDCIIVILVFESQKKSESFNNNFLFLFFFFNLQMKAMHLEISLWIALCVLTTHVFAQQSQLWSVNGNTEQTQYVRHQYQLEAANGQQFQQNQANNDNNDGRYQYQLEGNNQNTQSNVAYNQTETGYTIDQVIDTILASGRQGRNLDGFDEVYSDPTVQDAIQKGDDSQARNLIKDKLCSLGLMQCENNNNPKYLPNGELIYAQVPHAPNRVPPLPPYPSHPSLSGHKIIYGSPKPMPPGIAHKFGPPRKVGYGGPSGPGPIFNNPPPYIQSGPSFSPGPSFSSGPSSFHSGGSSFPSGASFSGPIYHSKPPGSIIDTDSPYKFDSIKEHVISNEEYQALQIGESAPQKVISNDGITGTGPNSVNIHHHYHHVDGADTKGTAVVVNNPIPVPVPINTGGGLITGDISSLHHHQSSHLNSGFNQLSSSYPSKPIFEQSPSYQGETGYGSTGLGASSLGSTGLGHQSAGVYNVGQGASFHSHNPDYYKKALKGGNSVNSLNSYNQQSSGGFGGLYSNGQNYQGESARQDNFDCVCVPFNQCPAQDILGRKGDLILPLDPRNLGSDIEAYADDSNNTATNSTVRVTKGTETSGEDRKDDETSIEQTKEEVKKVTKREVASEKKSDEVEKADGQAVSIFFLCYSFILFLLLFNLTN